MSRIERRIARHRANKWDPRRRWRRLSASPESLVIGRRRPRAAVSESADDRIAVQWRDPWDGPAAAASPRPLDRAAMSVASFGGARPTAEVPSREREQI